MLLDKTNKGCPEWQRMHHRVAVESLLFWWCSIKHSSESEDCFFSCLIAYPGGEMLNSALQGSSCTPVPSKQHKICSSVLKFIIDAKVHDTWVALSEGYCSIVIMMNREQQMKSFHPGSWSDTILNHDCER